MSTKKVRRSYDLPENLVNYFKNWKPGRDLSPKVAGAILYYLTLDAATCADCEQLAEDTDVEDAIQTLVSKRRERSELKAIISPELKAHVKPYIADFFDEYKKRGLSADLVLDAMIVAFDKIDSNFRNDCFLTVIDASYDIKRDRVLSVAEDQVKKSQELAAKQRCRTGPREPKEAG